MGEGAGLVVLKPSNMGVRREARTPLVEIVWLTVQCGAYHLTFCPENGEGAARAMQRHGLWRALRRIKIGYVNAHATSTPVG